MHICTVDSHGQSEEVHEYGVTEVHAPDTLTVDSIGFAYFSS